MAGSAVEPVRHARTATYVAFFGAGFAFASWASRIPQVRDALGLDAAELGLVLLAIACGSVLALPLSGAIVDRISSRTTVAAMAVLLAVALGVAAVGYHLGVWVLVVGLFLLGFANGAWDVAMNVQGAVVERRLGVDIMSRFHAGFSLGTVAGALVGAGLIALDVGVTPHLLATAALVATVVPVSVRAFLADIHEDADPTAARPARESWTEPRTLLIGVFVLAVAFGEGTANDWMSVALIDGYGASATAGTLGFATFLAAMTAARWVGPSLLARHGRVRTVRACAGVAVAGVALVVFGGSIPLALAGALLWGIGMALGFPVGMSAGADEPAYAAGRVSVIASLGYCAFLAGPPLIGFLGREYSVLSALAVVGVLMAVAFGLAGAVRPPATRRPE